MSLSKFARPALAIRHAIKEFRIPNVSHIADSAKLEPFGFYGIRGHYENGCGEIFLLDRGTEVVPIVSIFTPVA